MLLSHLRWPFLLSNRQESNGGVLVQVGQIARVEVRLGLPFLRARNDGAGVLATRGLELHLAFGLTLKQHFNRLA